MARQKTLTVEVAKQRRNWSIKVTGNDAEVGAALAKYVDALAHDYGAVIVNATDPFGAFRAPKPRRKRKAKELPSGTIELHNDGPRA